MRVWWLLLAATATEVSGTLALAGALEHRWLYAVTVLGEVSSFYLLVLVLQGGMALGVAYGVWSGLGVGATAVLSSVFFDEAFTAPMVLGLVLIVGGVLMVQVGSRPEVQTPDPGGAA